MASFERDNDPLGGRHHFRIFDTGKVDAQGQAVFAVAASLDNGVHFAPNSPQQWFISHSVDKNADKERDEVLRTLTKSGSVKSMSEAGNRPPSPGGRWSRPSWRERLPTG